MDEVSFTDWADSLDISGSNHWLPAYGYQQPMQDGDINDGGAMLVSSLQPPFIFLETIMEETSDDLRSESDRSGNAGWLDSSDSENDSVIHVPTGRERRDAGDDDAKLSWSGSERDLAVPKKRRRRTDDDDDEPETASLSSRSSSLLAFECLEKHCSEDSVFHTSATSDPFQGAGPKRDADYGFGYLTSANRWRFSDSSDSIDDPTEENSSSDEVSSDDTMLHSSWSSRGSYQQNRSLRSYRSFDSLNILQHKQQISLAELSQSLTNEDFILTQYDAFDVNLVSATVDLSKACDDDVKPRVVEEVLKKPGKRSAENLSEDSGFGDHVPKLSSSLQGRIRSATIIEDEDSLYYTSEGSSGDDDTASLKLTESDERRGWNHGEEEAAKFNCWQSAPNLAVAASVSELTASCERGVHDEDVMADMSSAPNLLLDVQHLVPLKHFEDDDKEDISKSLSTVRGVTFCPVVSEVSWRESYSEEEEPEVEEPEEEYEEESDTEDDEDDDADDGDEETVVIGCVEIGDIVEVYNQVEPAVKVADTDTMVVGTPMSDHVVPSLESVGVVSAPAVSPEPAMQAQVESARKKHSRFGSFFSRFSFRRRHDGDVKKEKKLSTSLEKATSTEDAVIIPLHPPDVVAVTSKPPLPPARAPAPPSRRLVTSDAASGSMSAARLGLLETDLDTEVTAVTSRPPLAPPKKARSLLNLGMSQGLSLMQNGGTHLKPGGGEAATHGTATNDARAKSMEFLLDKDNQAAVQPPENELQKGSGCAGGERVMSEHQLRVQRSLQKLNVPDWYKNSAVATRGHEGFLLKRDATGAASPRGETHHGWPGLGSKTTSLSSLGSTQSAAARSPTSHLLSPSPTPGAHVFTRWSTNRLNSGGTSASTSPCNSTRSSFNYRQPYLGWRSQERLAHPRTPAERLAAGIPQHKQEPEQIPNLSEVRTSIKEVTSAIVHYVSGVRDGSGELSTSSPRETARSSSPRGSGRLCWVESSFVGSRPVEAPETPVTGGDERPAPGDLYLDLNGGKHKQAGGFNARHVNGPDDTSAFEPDPDFDLLRNVDTELRRMSFEPRKPSPGSTTLEDVLDSLLGLPPTSRSPSPGGGTQSPANQRRSCGDITAGSASVGLGVTADPTDSVPYYVADTLRRRSEGSEPVMRAAKARAARRVSFDVATSSARADDAEPLVRCRYSKCSKTATIADARRNFKTCHNCAHVYCSRECRRAHWERHRKTCLHSRVGALCRQVLAAAKEDTGTLRHISLLARRGYLAQGRGAVKGFFSSPELAERFISRGFVDLGEPAYLRWSDLLPNEMGPELYSELVRLCKSYNPDTRLVLYVAVCVVSEVPTSGAVKWERQLVSRCAKLRLCRSLAAVMPQVPPHRAPTNITRDSENPETLILTSLPGCHGSMPAQRSREISFSNIQRHLRQRGVSLRRHFPDVYKKLSAYVEGSLDRFTPVTVYPRDVVSGKSFMCIIMPDAEPEKLEMMPRDSSRVQTIDVSIQPEGT